MAGRNYRKHLGLIKGSIAAMVLREEFEKLLDVTDTNVDATKCYESLGFKEFKRVKENHGKQKGFNDKIYMRYGVWR